MDKQTLTLKTIGYIDQILFSLNLAFAVVSVLDLKFHHIVAPFFQLEFAIHRLFHIQETDLVRGYIAFATSSAALALCIWLVLRLLLGVKLIHRPLVYTAGTVILVTPAAFWLFYYLKFGWPFGWPYRGAPFELVLALACEHLYFGGKYHFLYWSGIFLLAAHFAYWYWIAGGGNSFASNYTGPAAPVLGFCCGLVWGVYVAYLHSNTDEIVKRDI